MTRREKSDKPVTDDEAVPLDWSHAVEEVGPRGLDRERMATPEECAAIAATAGILGCERLVARYRLKAAAGQRYLMTGTVEADVTQACSVTLEPVPEKISEPIEVEFWPAGDVESLEMPEDEADILQMVDVEPVRSGRLSVGRVIYELVAVALDPYPRAAGVSLESELDEALDADKESARPNPFAALAKLRDKGGE